MPYEDTEFCIDESVEHETCAECGGSGMGPVLTTTFFKMTETGDAVRSLASAPPCPNADCYFGKILTPYEKKMQKLVYDLTGRARVSQNECAAMRSAAARTQGARLVAAIRNLFPCSIKQY